MGMDQALEVVEGGKRQEIATWRKDYDVHEIIVNVVVGLPRGPATRWSAHCELTFAQIIRVEQMLGWLCPEADLAFLQKAKAAFTRGAKVVYTADS